MQGFLRALEAIRCPEHIQHTNLICLQRQCQKKRLLCPICQQQYHKEHSIKPVKYFLKELIFDHQSTKTATILASIDSKIKSINNHITSNQISQQDRVQLQKAFNLYVSKLRTKINDQLQIQTDIEQFLDSTRNFSFQDMNKFMGKYQLHLYEPQEESTQKTKNTNFQKLLYLILEQLNEKQQNLSDILKSRPEIKDILGLFISESREKLSYHFSQQSKHTSIKIIDKFTAKQEHNYSSNFVLIEPILYGKKKTLQKKTVKIKIDKLNSWVNLGVCIKSKAIGSSFYFNTEDIGHGAYTISNDGYSWHNTDSASNSFYHGWGFVQGDTVTMVFDPKSKTIKYSKENADKQYQLVCEPIPGEEMYFCVTLNTHDETVSIVQ